MKREKESYRVQSVTHALDILESFTRSERELGVTELAKRLGLHKNNVFRLLATLEHRGYIEQNRDTENYHLGSKTLQIGSIFIEQRECRRHARPVLEGLMAATGETAVVAVLRSDKVIYMDSVESDRTVRAVSRAGDIYPAHCTAAGKVLLASLSVAELERLYPDNGLQQVTDRSQKDRAALFSELGGVRSAGVAFENEECDLDVKGVAAPVLDFSRQTVAAVGIVAPAHRFSEERGREGVIVERVRAAALAISSKLGHVTGRKA